MAVVKQNTDTALRSLHLVMDNAHTSIKCVSAGGVGWGPRVTELVLCLQVCKTWDGGSVPLAIGTWARRVTVPLSLGRDWWWRQAESKFLQMILSKMLKVCPSLPLGPEP